MWPPDRATSANSETETDLNAFSLCFSFLLFNGAFQERMNANVFVSPAHAFESDGLYLKRGGLGFIDSRPKPFVIFKS